METLPYVAIYIINQVKLRRLLAGIPAEELSGLIGMSSAYISGIESVETKSQYPLDILVKIAALLKCEVRDFYPPDELLRKNDNSHVFKKIVSLSGIEFTTEVIEGMIRQGYFDSGRRKGEKRTLDGVAKHLQVLGRKEAPVVQQALDEAVAQGKLIIRDGSYAQP